MRENSLVTRCVKIAVFVCVIMGFVRATALAQHPFDVRWSGERLSISAHDAVLADVVAEVSRIAGIEIVGGEKLSGQVTVDIMDLPPTEALAKLLAGVNYVVQERPQSADGAVRRLVVSVHSMVGYALPKSAFTGPVRVSALDAFVADEAEDEADDRDAEAEDPDTAEDMRQELGEASQLAAQGAFGPKVPLDSLIQLLKRPNDWVRAEAARALASRPATTVVSRALPALIAALGDASVDVRNTVVEILGHASDHESMQAIGLLLEKNEDRDMRIRALRVLALRAQPESARYLQIGLKDPDKFIHDVAEQIQAELDRRIRAKQGDVRP